MFDGELLRVEGLIGTRRVQSLTIGSSNRDCSRATAENRALLQEIYRLRFQTYCVEHGFASVNADREAQTIVDELDSGALHILVRSEGILLGCGRVNLSRNSKLGEFEDQLRMRDSKEHPRATAIVTKVMIKKGYRGCGVDRAVIDMMTTVGCEHGVRHVFMDCRLDLAPYYSKFGFRPCGPEFLHYETGRVVPMMLNLRDVGHLNRVGSILSKNKAVLLLNGIVDGGKP